MDMQYVSAQDFIHFEVITSCGKEPLHRLMTAILECGATIESSYRTGRPTFEPRNKQAVLMMKIPYSLLSKFKEVARPEFIEYRSPTYIAKGPGISIRNQFKTPEEELEARKLANPG